MLKVVVSVLGFCFFLTGCSSQFWGDKNYFRNREKDYKTSYLIDPLEVPADLAQIPESDQFPLPTNIPQEDATVALEPPFFETEES